MRQLPSRRLRDDHGGALPLVAAAAIVIFGAAALVIDLGNGWRTRRAMIPATDSASLAAAQEFIEGNSGCTNGTPQTYLSWNEPLANFVSCQHHIYPSGDQGRVTVTANHPVQTWFAPVIGLGNYTVNSTSTAVYGPPDGVLFLRPIGLCIDGSAALANLVNNPPTTPTLLTVSYTKDQPDDCGGTSIPGNWGTVDFDGGANSNADTQNWITNGYENPVYFSNHPVTSCFSEPHCYEGDTGALAGINTQLDDLRTSGIYFTVPLFNYIENPGSNALMHLIGVLRVRLIDYQLTGLQSTWFFQFMVEPGLIVGTCCGTGSGTSGNKVTVLCGVDPGAFAACDP